MARDHAAHVHQRCRHEPARAAHGSAVPVSHPKVRLSPLPEITTCCLDRGNSDLFGLFFGWSHRENVEIQIMESIDFGICISVLRARMECSKVADGEEILWRLQAKRMAFTVVVRAIIRDC